MTSASPIIRLACSQIDAQEVVDYLELATGTPYQDEVDDAAALLERACTFLSELSVDAPHDRASWYDLVTVSYGFVDAPPALLTELEPHCSLMPATPRARGGSVTLIATATLGDWGAAIWRADDAPDPDVRRALRAIYGDLAEMFPRTMEELVDAPEDEEGRK